jgi:hypothetical protein
VLSATAQLTEDDTYAFMNPLFRFAITGGTEPLETARALEKSGAELILAQARCSARSSSSAAVEVAGAPPTPRIVSGEPDRALRYGYILNRGESDCLLFQRLEA